MEICSANDLYEKGEIDAFEYQNPRLFGNRVIIKFSDRKDGLKFVYNFIQYLILKYGREEAMKFPLTKTGPAKENLLEVLGIESSFPNPIWFTIPKERFHEVEEFLNKRGG